MLEFLALCALLAVLVYLLFKWLCTSGAEGIGREGERKVASRLKCLSRDEYFVLHDLIIADDRGITTQIDHLVISRFGLFVIETKCYKGWIFANPKNRYWTQSLYAGGRGWFVRTEKHRFQNPIKQNWRHIFVLSERLKMPLRNFVNIVVFCGDVSFKTAVPDNVMGASDVVPYIRSFDKPLFGNDRAIGLLDSVCELCSAVSKEQREGHARAMHILHSAVPIANGPGKVPRCPRCGAAMRLRHRRSDNAPFYGCSNYPKCHGTIDVK